jgi:hypothetical protein
MAGLVYVCAYGMDAGESALSLNNTVPAAPIASDVVPDAAGFLTLSNSGVATDFAQDFPAAEQTTLQENENSS